MNPLNGDCCRTCIHFDNEPAQLELRIAGIQILGSAYSAVRASDGLCSLHDRYLSETSTCEQHKKRESVTMELFAAQSKLRRTAE